MMNGYKVNDTVCISIEGLYNKYGENLCYGGIVYTQKGVNNEDCSYYDLYNGFGVLDCMDGEVCKIIGIDDEKYVLLNENGEEDRIFYLSIEEFEVATVRVLKTLVEICPFCGNENRTETVKNLICICNAKFYIFDGLWLNRVTGDRVEMDLASKMLLGDWVRETLGK